MTERASEPGCWQVLRREGPGRRFEAYHRCRAERPHGRLWSALLVVAGVVLVVAGLLLSLVPGLPGIVLGIPGLALVGGEFRATARLLDRGEVAVRGLGRRLGLGGGKDGG